MGLDNIEFREIATKMFLEENLFLYLLENLTAKNSWGGNGMGGGGGGVGGIYSLSTISLK